MHKFSIIFHLQISGDENKRNFQRRIDYDDDYYDGSDEDESDSKKSRKRRKLLQMLKRIQASEKYDDDIINHYKDDYDYYDYLLDDKDQVFLTSDPMSKKGIVRAAFDFWKISLFLNFYRQIKKRIPEAKELFERYQEPISDEEIPWSIFATLPSAICKLSVKSGKFAIS